MFVIFLDTGNVGIPGAHDINGPIKELLTRLLGPDDLIGLMTPDMSPDQITFARKTQAIEQGLTENWAWGRKGTLILDEQERKYDMCFDNREQKARDHPPAPRTRGARQPAGSNPAHGVDP